MSRDVALDAVRKRDGRFPWAYLGKDLALILEPLEMSVEEFISVCDRFTNRKIFKRDATGALVKDRSGNLERLNDDNP